MLIIVGCYPRRRGSVVSSRRAGDIDHVWATTICTSEVQTVLDADGANVLLIVKHTGTGARSLSFAHGIQVKRVKQSIARAVPRLTLLTEKFRQLISSHRKRGRLP
jgi:hypothetical protein